MTGLTGASDAPEGGAADQGATVPPTSARLRREAITWYVRLGSGEATDADRMAWRAWYAADEAHRQAWRPFETLGSTLSRLPVEVAGNALEIARRRRRVLRDLGLLAISGGAGWVAWSAGGTGGMTHWLADQRTAPGEQRSMHLADGSRLLLNTRTAVDIRFDAAHRLIHLLGGELLAITAPGIDARPFIIETPHGRVQALGTRFTVRTDADATVVAVLEHAVQIRPDRASDRPLTLEAGQQTRFTQEAVDPPAALDPWLTDWTGGSLVVHDRPLGEVLLELARYRRGHLGWDPAVAGLRVSGALPLADTDKALAVIARSLPVRISTRTRYWVKVLPR